MDKDFPQNLLINNEVTVVIEEKLENTKQLLTVQTLYVYPYPFIINFPYLTHSYNADPVEPICTRLFLCNVTPPLIYNMLPYQTLIVQVF